MFSFKLYIYDMNFNLQSGEIDLFPALLNEDISLTIERERGVFEKTNSDLSLNFSNLVKLSNGLTIFQYLNTNIASKKFRIKVLSDSKIVFDGYVENESISYDVENETLSLNVFAIEKEFWKRCENILFSEINPYLSNEVANTEDYYNTRKHPNYIWTIDYVFQNIFLNINNKQYFYDILNNLTLNIPDVIKNRRMLLRNNTLKTGFYWIDREKLNLKEFFEVLFKVYNLEFKIDYDTKQGIFQQRLVTTGNTLNITNDVIKSGITYSPQIEKFDLIKVNDVADINNSELFEFSNTTHALDSEWLHDGNSLFDYPSPFSQIGFEEEVRSAFGISSNATLHQSTTINFKNNTLKLYFYIELTDGRKFISNKALHERVVPSDDDNSHFPNYIIPTITDISNIVKSKIIILGGDFTLFSRITDNNGQTTNYHTIYQVYEIENSNNQSISVTTAVPHLSPIYSIKYFVDTITRDAYLFDGYETIKDSSYLDIDNVLITNETQIKRSNIFELENEIKLKFHEDKNNDGTLNTDEDKPKEATRNQIQKMFRLSGQFYQTLISSFKNILKSTSKIECEVNRDDLRVGDKVTINYNDINGNFVVNKNEIDLINGISKIEALSEVIN